MQTKSFEFYMANGTQQQYLDTLMEQCHAQGIGPISLGDRITINWGNIPDALC